MFPYPDPKNQDEYQANLAARLANTPDPRTGKTMGQYFDAIDRTIGSGFKAAEDNLDAFFNMLGGGTDRRKAVNQVNNAIRRRK